MPDVPIYRVGPQPGGPLYVPDAPNNREGPQAREPSKCLNGQSYRERLVKKTFWLPPTRVSKNDSDRAITPVVEAVHVPAHLVPPGSSQAKELHHLHVQLSLSKRCQRQKKVLRLCTQSHSGCVQLFVTLWTVACQSPLSEEFSRQEYWSVLVNIGCYTLLEHCISCCPSSQLPWVSCTTRTPATQAAAPPPHLALTGVDLSPPGQPQEQTLVDDLHAELEIKPQLNPRGSVAKKEDPKPSHQVYKLQIKSTGSTM